MENMRQIIALGGGGFSDEPDNPLLDQYVLGQSKQDNPKICFISTASGDSKEYIDAFYQCFDHLTCEPSHLSLFAGHTDAMEEFVLSRDILFVGGGNTRNMLVLWKEWGLDILLKRAYEQGIILSGVSAGGICWFEGGLTDSIPKRLTGLSGLGFLKGSFCPHYDSENLRRSAYQELIESGKLQEGYACDDGVALHYVNEELISVISSRKASYAYYLSQNILPNEKRIRPEYLG